MPKRLSLSVGCILADGRRLSDVALESGLGSGLGAQHRTCDCVVTAEILRPMQTTDTIPRGRGPAGQPQRQPVLCVVYSGQLETRAATDVRLSIGSTPIGRETVEGRGCELRSDPRLSRRHARVEVNEDLVCTLVAGEGKNGTFVNGAQISSHSTLRDGDVIRAGDSLIVFRVRKGGQRDSAIPSLIGSSGEMAELRTKLLHVAKDDIPVLIYGETGTGKELVARALHKASDRSAAFIDVNCAALDTELVDSQLFGYVAGAFTGARGAQPGFFRAADRGTLFLDEIGELPLTTQAKLLRVMQEGTVTPVGAVHSVPCAARIVAATHRDLLAMVQRNQFRDDLFARLNGITLHTPPVRSRREDILLLLQHALGEAKPSITADLVERLLTYAYPRNVRDLQKFANHLRLFGEDDDLLALLQTSPTAPAPATTTMAAHPPGIRIALPTPPREIVLASMERHHGVISRVAADLGCSRRQVGRYLDEHQIDRARFRTPGSIEEKDEEGEE